MEVEARHINPIFTTLYGVRSFDIQSSQRVERATKKSDSIDQSINDLVEVIIEENQHAESKIDIDKVTHTINFAKEAHAGHNRKVTGEPYILHPLRVARLVIQEGEKVIITALLHDVAEDTPKTLQDIENEFGEDIRTDVEHITEREFEKRIPHDTPQKIKEEDWIKRKVRQLTRIPKMSRTARIIEAANATDNLRSMQREFTILREKAFDPLTVGKFLQRWRYNALSESLEAYQKKSGEINKFLPELKREFNKWKIMVFS